MPSPSFDPWFASRRFGIIIDAGSSGSRLQIYSWLVNNNDPTSSQPALPVVERGSKDPDNWLIKTQPGISSFANSPHLIKDHLARLLQHARDYIPPSLHSETPLFLYATAGMRLLPPQDQTALLKAACDFLRFHSEFRISDDDDNDNDENREVNDKHTPDNDQVSSPPACKNHVRVISGEEEGLFGWIAVNYLMDAFTSVSNSNHSSYGFLDMGGASAQIAFKVDSNSEAQSSPSLPLMPVTLNLLNGESIHHDVFVTTWLGYGTNQARERYVARIAETVPTPGDQNPIFIPDPCLPRGLSIPFNDIGTRHNPIIIEDDFENEEDEDFISKPNLYLRGTGSFDECLSLTAELLQVNTSTSKSQYPPLPLPFPLPLETTPFVGISEYWYTSEHIFGLGGAYDDAAFQEAAKRFCAVDWKNIEFLYLGLGMGEEGDEDESSSKDQLLVGPHSKYASEIDVQRLEMQCFKSAWMMNVLHLGLGMPRSRMVEGNKDDRESAIFVGDGANVPVPPPPSHSIEQPKLTKPMFQSVDTIRDTSISWTLGKMVLEASREVSRGLSNGHRQKQKQQPKITPHVDTSHIEPTQFITHPPQAHISPSPSPLILSSPFILFLLYASTLFVLFLISCRLGIWYQVKVALRRRWRKGGRGKLGKTGNRAENGFTQLEMEEGLGFAEAGKQGGGGLLLFSSILSSARRSISFIATRSARPAKKNLESYPMNGHAKGYSNHSQSLLFPVSDSDGVHDMDMSLSDLETIPDSNAYHYNSNENAALARVVHRSSSLPVLQSASASSSSSNRSKPQTHSNFSAVSTPTYTLPFPGTSTPTSTVGSAGTSLTTALTTQPLNHLSLAQSRSRNSSQVSLVNPSGTAFGVGSSRVGVSLGLLARSANSSQVSLVSSKKGL